uniref:hypothetical protein n=1 Tax=Agathobacter sp. TaxID=2021311 RepID=UPI004056C133
MKLKYYLRGIGVGIIAATIILTVSAMGHNHNLTEEQIMEEALKLGMVMPESTQNEEESQETDSQAQQDVLEGQSEEESENQASSEIHQANEEESQAASEQQEDEGALGTQIASESQQGNEASSENPQSNEDSQGTEIVLTQDTYASSYRNLVVVTKSPDNPTREILIQIKAGAACEHVGEVLYACGYIESEQAFSDYMRSNSYAYRIRTGQKVIPAGSTYAEIAEILMSKQ